MSAYVVLHNMVGPHFTDEVVEIGEDAEKAGVDAQRLLDIGAVREATADEAETAVPYGQGNEDSVRRFPPVPFDSVQTVIPAPEPEGTSEDSPKGRSRRSK